MKKKLKKYLLKTGLFNLYCHIFDLFKTINPSVLSYEFIYKIKRTPHGYPFPPNRMIFLVIGTGWSKHYYVEGKAIVDNMKKHLLNNSIDINNFSRILDFGCGCGRLIIHLEKMKNVELYGCDCNKDLIKWCQKNLTFANFQINNPAPPINYESSMFDFIYLRSVFTHLSAEMQKKWITELKRILRPKGILLFTTMGTQYKEHLNIKQKNQYESGELVSIYMKNGVTNRFEGTNYLAIFQSLEFVKKNLLDGFELVNFIPGGEIKVFKGRVKQDIYIFRKQ